MTTAKQIITLEIEVNIDRLPLPEHWDWDELTRQLDGAATVRVLAAGLPTFERDNPRGDAVCDTAAPSVEPLKVEVLT